MAPPAASGRQSGSFALSRAFSRKGSISSQDGAPGGMGAQQSNPQQVAIQAMRERLQSHNVVLTQQSPIVFAGDVDATLLRFLRARKMNIDAATNMMLACLKWRQKVGADTALQVPLDPRLVELCRSCRPSSYVAFDAKGRPIFLERLGPIDPHRMEKAKLSVDSILAYHLREMEYMAQVLFAEASVKAGHTVDKVITVVDAAGLRLGTLTGFVQRMFRALASMDSDNYPEAAAAIYICNNSQAFSMIWKVLSAFVDKGTRDKVHIMGHGKHMEAAMREAGFAPDMLPTFLGGSLDYDTARQHWLDKMDAAMVQAQQHAGQQRQTGNSFDKEHGRGTSPLAVNVGQSGHMEDAGSDGWHTPTAASRAGSVSSVHSLYFEANQSFTEGSASPSSHAGADLHQHKSGGSPGHTKSPLAPAPVRSQDATGGTQLPDKEAEDDGAQPRCLPLCGCCCIS